METIIDTCVLIDALYNQTHASHTQKLLLEQEVLCAPHIFVVEFLNFVSRTTREPNLVAEVLANFESIPVLLQDITAPTHLVHLAQTYDISSYDASFLALALTRGGQLATLDAKLAAAAHRAGVYNPLGHLLG